MLELLLVCGGKGHVGREIRHDLDVPDPRLIGQQVQSLLDDLVDGHRRLLRRTPPNGCEEVPHDPRSPVCGIDDLRDTGLHLRILAGAAEHLRVAQHHGERVFQLVSDSADQFPQRRELLGLDESLRQSLARCDVLLDRDEVGNLPVTTANRGDRLLLVVEAPVLAAVDDLPVPGSPGPDGLPEVMVERRIVTSRFEDAGRAADGLVGVVTGQLREPRIGPDDGALAVGDQDAVDRGLERSALESHVVFDTPPLADVPPYSEDPDRPTGLVAHEADLDLGPDRGAVLALDFQLHRARPKRVGLTCALAREFLDRRPSDDL